ncbi:polyprenyl synthetase family protein [Fervidibacter sacchari]|uniref:Octaprenyl-diphosphate synthase n=1 Tax=Candidatus Fervidibacter sacchari TaxID=1448929 RepID=A0ABT2EQM3_9BACT|nr:polyprenyl synthetase family protein [Candidatus Fervidibacter sacchari]MCS3920232.1 octaprenyl-diphosphate synthase [Candidatus Fervidibacter sacchari]WKU14800.1 polyprenyl synthetase family protein [Candidatus Fervidibacter sacchari]
MKGLQRLAINYRWDDSLTSVFTFLEKPMQKVEEILREAVQSTVREMTAMAMHLLSAGGKRLRPALTLLSAKLAGEINHRALLFAAAIELMHTATLIHDDVIDKADLRRGRATVHSLWGNEAAVMCGDFLYATAFNMLAKDGDVEVIRTMALASSQVCEGEVLELQLAFNPEITEEQCVEIARLKTAELMAAACKVGAMASGANGELISAMESFGRNLGIAFQIVDDVLDMEGSVEEIGKPVGSDLLEGKVTLPVRLTLDALPEEKRAILKQRIAKREVTSQDAADLAKFAKENGILEQARARAKKFAEKALEQLTKVANEANSLEAINVLKRLAHFSVHRRF